MKLRREYDRKQIGRNLRRLREEKSLTVEEVREYLCLGSVQAEYKYEKGISYPPADTMFALMELYGAGLYDIIEAPEEDRRAFSMVWEIHDVFGDRAEKRQIKTIRRYCAAIGLLRKHIDLTGYRD